MKEHPKYQKILKIMCTVITTAFFLVLTYLIYRLTADQEKFTQWLLQYGEMSRLIYVIIVALQVVLALIPGEVLEIAGGYLFGIWGGTIFNLLGAFIGSMLVFILVRKFGRPLVMTFFKEEKIEKLRFLKDSKKRNFLLSLIFILPGTPKDLLCYCAGLTDIQGGIWLFVCSIGRLPSVITSVIGGNALENKNYGSALIAFAVAALISLFGILIYRVFSKRIS